MMNYPDRSHHPKEDLAFARLAERDSGTRLAVWSVITLFAWRVVWTRPYPV